MQGVRTVHDLEARFRILDRLQREVVRAPRVELKRALGGLEAERLRPHAVRARGKRREDVAAGLVGVDARVDRRAFAVGGDRDAIERLARGADGAGQVTTPCPRWSAPGDRESRRPGRCTR